MGEAKARPAQNIETRMNVSSEEITYFCKRIKDLNKKLAAKEITEEQRDLLQPFGEALHAWSQQIRGSSVEELTRLRDACDAASGTNCWASTFDASRTLLPMVLRELQQRANFCAQPRKPISP